jgi:hypothetical protein
VNIVIYEDMDNIIENIRQSLLRINSMEIETIKDSIDMMGQVNTEAMQESIDTMNQINTEAMQESIDTMNQINTEAMNQSMNLISKINTNAIQESIDMMNTINQIDIETLSTQFSPILMDLVDASIFKSYEILNKSYDRVQINQPELIKTLNKYQWFVLPKMPMDFVSEILNLSNMNKPRTRINKHFFNYFAYNNFENLRGLVNDWDSSRKFRPGRLKVIKDCLNAIIHCENKKIPSTLVVPTLIAQIDGIQREFLLKNNFKISRTKFKFEGQGKPMGQIEAWKHIYSPNDYFSSVINDVILDVLFGTVNPGEPIHTPITFSRHKIMHGEHLNYGTVSNTFRTFIILDFLHDLL